MTMLSQAEAAREALRWVTDAAVPVPGGLAWPETRQPDGRVSDDLYDGTAALTMGVAGGALYRLNDRFDLNGQIMFRYNSGLSKIDALVGTGLDNTNDKSSRWTMPITFGLRVKF